MIRATLRLSLATTTVASLLACSNIFPDRTFADSDCQCSAKVPWDWDRQWLLDEDGLEVGDSTSEVYVTVERIDKRTYEAPASAAWLANQMMADLSLRPINAASEGPDSTLRYLEIGGYPAAGVRVWEDGGWYETAYWIVVVDHPDAFLVAQGWCDEDDQIMDMGVISKVIHSLEYTGGQPGEVVDTWMEMAPPEQSPVPLDEARAGWVTTTVPNEVWDQVPPEPPGREGVALVQYEAEPGAMWAYLSEDPGDGARHPAVLWTTGGFDGIGPELFAQAPAADDQTVRAFLDAGLVVMTPSFRGQHDNPGDFGLFWGEVDDLLAARDHLAQLPYVDPERIYLAGHSTGGTLTLLAATRTADFRAAWALGGDPLIGEYYGDPLLYEEAPYEADPQEDHLRSPAYFARYIRRPVQAIEGEDNGSSVVEGESMEAAARLHGAPFQSDLVPRSDHFAHVGALTATLAQKILADTGPEPDTYLGPRELWEVGEQAKALRDAQLLDQAQAQVELALRRATRSLEEIRAELDYLLVDEPTPAQASALDGIFEEAVARRRAEEATWPAQTDVDRLQAAFASLRRQGFLVHEDYEDCAECAASLVWEELDEAAAHGEIHPGYVFYTWPDLDRVLEDDTLYLAYGDGKGEGLAAGEALREALARQGFEVIWSGDPTERVAVKVRWQRRLPPSAG